MPYRVRDLRERRVGDRDVIGCGVRTGLPRPQQTGQRLVRVVQVGHDRMKTKTAFERRHSLFLLRVRGHQRRVDVDHQPGQLPAPRHSGR